MKISTKGRYALRMLLDLAQHRDKGFVPLKDIAERQNVSKKYLEQIVPILNKSDMLQTNRGFQGGCLLYTSRSDSMRVYYDGRVSERQETIITR